MPRLPAPALSLYCSSISHCCFLSNNDFTVVAEKRFCLDDKIASPHCEKKQVCLAIDVLDVVALGKQTLQFPEYLKCHGCVSWKTQILTFFS